MIDEIRLMTWNVNGLRASMQRLKKTSLKEYLADLGADILCFQETKMTRSELEEELARPDGYDAFYSFCRVRSGYSGVVTFCRSGKVPTIAAEEGLTGMWKVEDAVGHIGSKHLELAPKTLNELESEGRCVITDHQAFVLINVYCPASRNSERVQYKLAFHDLLQDRVESLQRAGRRVIVVGDINISHREIDHCDPEPNGEVAFKDHPCRLWMDGFVGDASVTEPQDLRLVDAFRHFHPTQREAFTCWNMVTAARQTNFGTRIDYILVNRELMNDSVTSCSIQPEQMGSDHCPVVSTLVVQFDMPQNGSDFKTADLCAKFFAEFAGKQQSLRAFFTQQQPVDGPTSAELSSPKAATKARPGSASSSSSSQRSIASFFLKPAQTPPSNAVSSSAVKPPSPPPTEPIDTDVWAEVLGSKRRLAEEEQSKWKQVLSGKPPKTPLCHCGEPTVLRTVLKTNDNWGRKFYVCTRPEGVKGHPDARCEFFQWVDMKKAKR